jgi:hypothetical protein
MIAIISITSIAGMVTEEHGLLIVEIVDADSQEASSADYVRESIEKGGSIKINVGVAREVDPNFDRFAVSNEEGMFIIAPTIATWLGGSGWKFQSSVLSSMYFVR